MERLVRDPAAYADFRKAVDAGKVDPDQVRYDWDLWARPNQQMPQGKWLIWLMLGGRGMGKSRSLSEFVRKMKDRHPRGILVARTAADLRNTMVEGDSGILACSPPWDRPIYTKIPHRLTWSNGAVASLFSAEEPDALRGPQCNWFAADELATWKYLDDAWANLMFGWRLEPGPKGFIATTPRPVKVLKDLMDRKDVAVTRGSSYENAANLAPEYYANVIAPYEGTRLGRQEIEGELLLDVPGALWTYEMLDACRVERDKMPTMRRIVVAIDPAVTSGEASDLTGIIVAGVGTDGHGYVLEDATIKGSPLVWARQAISRFAKWEADLIVAEVNNGGELVERNLRAVDRRIPFKAVRATRGKLKRAEPVANMFEQKMIHIPRDQQAFGELEEQLRMFTPDEKFLKSPDRADAMVWAFYDLFKLEDRLKRARTLW